MFVFVKLTFEMWGGNFIHFRLKDGCFLKVSTFFLDTKGPDPRGVKHTTFGLILNALTIWAIKAIFYAMC